MSYTITRLAGEVLGDSLKELESPKGSVLSGVQKLQRAASLLGEEDIRIWCEIQLGNDKYTIPLSGYCDVINTALKDYAEKQSGKRRSTRKDLDDEKLSLQLLEKMQALEELGLKQEIHFSHEEVLIKSRKSAGGYQNIGSLETLLTRLIKVGNDGTYYATPVSEHINHIRRVAHDYASKLYKRVAFSNTPQTSLDILRAEVDSKLLDIAPAAAEKLMIAFKSVASDNPEEWSQALTTCRRFIEALADALYPSIDDALKGRSLGKGQYINRLWAFMDNAIESESNRELAKSHVDYLGSYLERTHKLSNKGVHAELKRIEAVKAVFHAYLVAADILDYLKKVSGREKKKLNIHTASIDELESILNISRNLAKEIVKLRVECGVMDIARLATIKGIGRKTVALAEQVLSFEPAT
jgi:DNA uptake protein ComE-like DNA-binding protein